jgi:hypothetical protein
MKILPVGAELFHADRHDEADSRFSQICECAQNQQVSVEHNIYLL